MDCLVVTEHDSDDHGQTVNVSPVVIGGGGCLFGRTINFGADAATMFLELFWKVELGEVGGFNIHGFH